MDDCWEPKADAEKWLQDNSSRFKLLSFDQNENQLVFGTHDAQVSFSVVCPGPGDSWSVCSEQPTVLQHLQDVMEYLDREDNQTIGTVLHRVTQSLAEVGSASQSVPSTLSPSSSASQKEKDGDDDGDHFEDALDDEEEEEEDVDFGYYEEEDLDTVEKEEHQEEEEDKTMETFFRGNGDKASPSTIQRLCSDMKSLAKTGQQFGFSAKPEGDNLFKWNVKLLDIPDDCRLGKDLQRYAQKTKQEAVIQMEMQFPTDYPFSPPFLRVIRPRFRFLTGHVTIGGSICMEMLTKSGWLPTNDIEGILVQVRCEILSDPKASLDESSWDMPYTEQEARAAFNRMVHRYGWNK